MKRAQSTEQSCIFTTDLRSNLSTLLLPIDDNY